MSRKLHAGEIRTLAWNDISTRQVWPFVGGLAHLLMPYEVKREKSAA